MSTPDPNELLEQIQKNTGQALRYARMRFLATWAAVGLLAILVCLALSLAINTSKTNLEQTDDIAVLASDTADDAQETADQTVSYLRGDQGIPGVPGANGEDGAPGQPASNTGARGPAGPAGPSGPAGPFGPIGPIGQPGPAGIDGQNGTDGTDANEIGPQGSEGQRGPEGPEGPRGAEGATGPAGPQGPQGPAPPFAPPSTTIALGQSVNDPNTPKTANATCPSGRATGGGFAIVPSDPGLIITASSPVGNNGWSATAEELSFPAANNWQLLAFVTCMVP